MESSVYHIQSLALRPFVQYVLFNYAKKSTSEERVTSLPNSNFCLGITKGKELCKTEKGLVFRPKEGLGTYLSGLYTEPHVFCCTDELDEICIDFTLAGYHRFFVTPPSTYLFSEDLLLPNFGPQAETFFEHLFGIEDRYVRGLGIEQFLLFRMRANERKVPAYLHVFTSCAPLSTVSSLAEELQYSERKLQRLCAKELAVSPKQLLRILRFRSLLGVLGNCVEGNNINWEILAYDNGYFDYSHLHRDFQQLTGRSPVEFSRNSRRIDATVTVCLE